MTMDQTKPRRGRTCASPLLLSLLVVVLTSSCAGGTDYLVTNELADEIADSTSRKIRGSSEAAYQFMLGELAMKEERFDDALQHYREAAGGESRSAPTLRKRLAQLHLRRGELDQALAETNKGLQQETDNVELIRMQAGILAAQKRNEEAIAAYQRLIDISGPNSEDPYILLASLYLQQENIPAAKDVLEKLLQKKPRSFIAVYYLARLSLVSGALAEAEILYRRALELTANRDAVELDLARVLALQKKYDKAIEITDQIIERSPGNTRARDLRGDILLGDDRVQDALKEFETLQTLETDPSQTRLKIALIKLQRRDYEGAEVELRLVLSQNPDNPAARYYLASVYAAMRRSDQALEQIRAIPQGKEFYIEGSTLAVYLLREEKRYDEAIKTVDDLLSIRPDNTKLLILRASLLRENKQPEEAIQSVLRAIEKQPNKDEYYFSLGVYYDDAGKKEDAMEAMRKAIELNPANANALNYLGYTYAEQGVRLEEARELIQRALEIEPQNGYFLDSLGWVYYQMGKHEDALRELQRAAELAADDAVVLEHLARVLLKLNRRDEAIALLRKARSGAPESDDKNVGERIDQLFRELGVSPEE